MNARETNPHAFARARTGAGFWPARDRKSKRQGRKTTGSCWISGLNINLLNVIAKSLEFADHSGGASTLGLGTDGRSPFLVGDALVKNLPDQTAETVSDGPDISDVAEGGER